MIDQPDGNKPVGLGLPCVTERLDLQSSGAKCQPQDSASTLVYEPVLGPNHQNEEGPDVRTPSQTLRLVGFPEMNSPTHCTTGHKLFAPGAPGPSTCHPVLATPISEPKSVRSPGTANSVRGKGRRPPVPPAAKLPF